MPVGEDWINKALIRRGFAPVVFVAMLVERHDTTIREWVKKRFVMAIRDGCYIYVDLFSLESHFRHTRNFTMASLVARYRERLIEKVTQTGVKSNVDRTIQHYLTGNKGNGARGFVAK